MIFPIAKAFTFCALAGTAFASVLKRDAGNLEKRANCAGSIIAKTSDVVACANQLTGKGSNGCKVPGPGGSEMYCHIGTCKVVGVNVGTRSEGDIPCEDVARAVGFILDDCTQNNGLGDYTGGQTAAYNHGELNIIAGGYQ